ncbi:hypothetical protein HYC85_012032 [Camellia sinensis]|uniref:N-acetyltransferase domain-containing protein n=1 Tax=Camellia sinensis TaxID=4442 RepID=A0A7J7HBB4_CAMSI|nr:hypothetical protein HYC85_012032 [Camellia sinensis]
MDSKSEMEENISNSSSSSSDDCPNPDHTETPQRQLWFLKVLGFALTVFASFVGILVITGNAIKRETWNPSMSTVHPPHFVSRVVYEKLEKMVGVRIELDEGFSWTLLRQMDQEFGVQLDDLYQIIECHSKLAVARIVMEECFEPIKDCNTKINVIRNVVYNRKSNYTRTNFSGFHSAILEKDDEIISVASVRIHGTKLAEMPFIATRESYRSQGMYRRLMVAIESALCYLKVESMVIPSIREKIGTWIERYGFQHIGPSLSKEIRHRNTLTFHDSYRLQKILAVPQAFKLLQLSSFLSSSEAYVILSLSSDFGNSHSGFPLSGKPVFLLVLFLVAFQEALLHC